ncbi:MAG TPA: helix-turn-helix domain-containing protein [Candidatus Enterocola sp.]|nr:helix-turn-helix domain-containing protein [Candidatus Enterocola sp.]
MNKKHISTKENILQTTIDLLNKKGLQNVTFRDVADALHISLGNITYYFHKWDNLMDVIFTDYCVKDVKELYLYFPNNIHEIGQYLSRIYDVQIKYTFVFSNFYLFFNVFPRYNHFKEEFFIDRMDKMRLGFVHLAEQNYMYPPSKDHDYDLLTKDMWVFVANWYGFSRMFNDSPNRITKEQFFMSIYNISVFHLTEEGKIAILESFDKLRKEGVFDK